MDWFSQTWRYHGSTSPMGWGPPPLGTKKPEETPLGQVCHTQQETAEYVRRAGLEFRIPLIEGPSPRAEWVGPGPRISGLRCSAPPRWNECTPAQTSTPTRRRGVHGPIRTLLRQETSLQDAADQVLRPQRTDHPG